MHRILLILSLIPTLSSCLIIPHYETLTGKMHGRLVDEHGRPVSGAKIEYLYNSHYLLGSATTTNTGAFKLGPFRQWFYVVYLGSPGACPFPYTLDGYFAYPDALKVQLGQAVGFYLVGSKEQHLSTLPDTKLVNFKLPPGMKWTGTKAFPTVVLRADTREYFAPEID